MRRLVPGLLIALSAALTLGYGVAFLVRWGVRGLIACAILGVVAALAAAAANGAIPGRGPRLAAAFAYLLLAGVAVLSLVETFKNDLLRDLLLLQLATGAVGLLACAWPRRE